MPTALTRLIDDLEKHPQLLTLVACLGLLLAAWVLNWIVKRILVRGFYRLLRSTSFGQDQELNHHRVIGRLANIVPALVLSIGIELVPGRPEALVTVVQNVCSAFIVLTIALALGSALNVVNVLYSRRPSARLKPIKGYVQVSKIVIYAIAVILMIATLIDRSPLILLSGLGAMAAVLLLIFQDTLLSLVASVQISSNDIIRVGDWIEMPQLNADGDVIDIALHTVKVQNFDKTITTIPTKRFITDSFRNYRGMQEAGGRRIKRALNIDQNSVHFLSDAEREHLHRFNLLDDYLTAKEQELADWNRKLEKRGQEPVNTRRVTNLGTFRAYVERYLRAHPGVHQGMTLLVRQMPLSGEGLPVEIYCFTNTTVWAQYEGIQGDIFDHLLSILPEFGLHVFQHPSGRDFRMRLEPTEAMTSLGEPGTPAP
ncbi:mechanosensitive ion channel family protein [Pseudomonas psychrotolerans L19]|uniref:mechanosensitive ion channel family protein n=1 Tax=Pseudomonas oryzihabitans TaxID=47885 RepID=UPI00023A3EAA|nr:mechanosensitive ion channel family protein [Pseudomonas psychrotolerans]EHK68523.1 mechanosensitive ion channel family protein [Pseudomonas psychrotolerans L19]MBA1183309.1 mechanosensitive ion channel family protein [Pseudomonas psychrotolerans]